MEGSSIHPGLNKSHSANPVLKSHWLPAALVIGGIAALIISSSGLLIPSERLPSALAQMTAKMGRHVCEGMLISGCAASLLGIGLEVRIFKNGSLNPSSRHNPSNERDPDPGVKKSKQEQEVKIDKNASLDDFFDAFKGSRPSSPIVLKEEDEKRLISLLNEGNVNVQDGQGNTILHYAVYNVRPALVSAILTVKGVNANIQEDEHEETPLHSCQYLKETEDSIAIFKALLQKDGVDVNILDRKGANLLYCLLLDDTKNEVLFNLLIERTDVDFIFPRDWGGELFIKQQSNQMTLEEKLFLITQHIPKGPRKDKLCEKLRSRQPNL